MNGYLAHFLIYTMAMIGFIVLALYVYKKSSVHTMQAGSREYLKIENALRLTPGKTIYVIKAGTERFLIAGDAQNTTMLSKLSEDNIPEKKEPEISGIKKFISSETIQQLYRG